MVKRSLEADMDTYLDNVKSAHPAKDNGARRNAHSENRSRGSLTKSFPKFLQQFDNISNYLSALGSGVVPLMIWRSTQKVYGNC